MLVVCIFLPVIYAQAKQTGFIWPAKGRIISYYGDTVNNIPNKGIDIYIPVKTPVVAVEEGRVKFCQEIKGYGKTVIVDHKGGLSSVYSNLEKVYTKEGRYVTKNTAIGNIGNNSYLHFEIRKNGKSKNPLKYLK